MAICRACGGVLGADCWNEADCMAIMADMARHSSEQNDKEEILEKALRAILEACPDEPGDGHPSYKTWKIVTDALRQIEKGRL